MSDTINLRRSVNSLEKQPTFDGYSKVILTVSDEVEYTAGTDAGRTLTVDCPWGTQDMADRILSKVRGFQYQPFSASGAYVDPSVEIGDGITAGKVYSGVFSKKVYHGPLYTADISAPGGENINYEYKYKSPVERRVERNYKELRSSFRVQAGLIEAEVEERKSDIESINGKLSVQSDLISAKVSKTGGSPSSFGWDLADSYWALKANNAEVLRATKDGLEIYGIIRATGGKIGGLDIQANYLSYNGQTWGGTNSTGIYAGPSGIQCGPAETGVRITSSGNLYAENGYFRGSVNAGNIQYGGNAGYLSGSGLASHSVYGSQIGYNTISTSYTSGGINTSLGYADFANGVFGGWNRAKYGYFSNLSGSAYVSLLGHDCKWRRIKDGNGNYQNVLVYDE